MPCRSQVDPANVEPTHFPTAYFIAIVENACSSPRCCSSCSCGGHGAAADLNSKTTVVRGYFLDIDVRPYHHHWPFPTVACCSSATATAIAAAQSDSLGLFGLTNSDSTNGCPGCEGGGENCFSEAINYTSRLLNGAADLPEWRFPQSNCFHSTIHSSLSWLISTTHLKYS